MRRPRRWSYDLFDDRDFVGVSLSQPPRIVNLRRSILNRELHPNLAGRFGRFVRWPPLYLITRNQIANICLIAVFDPTIKLSAEFVDPFTISARHTPIVSKNARHTPIISLDARHTPIIRKKAGLDVCGI